MKRSLGLLLFALLLALGLLYFGVRSPDAPAPRAAVESCGQKHEMNSKAYWDCRFSTQDWQTRHGPDQSRYFYRLMVDGLPEEFRREIRAGKYSVVDFGCAQGEGTELFALEFPDSQVTGVDISPEAVRIAKEKNRKAAFLATDLTAHPGVWDVMITSNTLEHFHRPWEMLEKLSGRVKRYFIILVPFEEPNVPRPNAEHFYSFNDANIPRMVSGFKLVHGAVMPTDQRFWAGRQVLLIFQKQ